LIEPRVFVCLAIASEAKKIDLYGAMTYI